MRLTSLALVAPVLFTLPACGSSSAIKAATYLQPTAFFEDAEDGEEADEEGRKFVEATDCLNIQPAANGAIRYGFALHFPYDHMCEMHGTAALESPGVWVDSSQEGCRLVISFDGKSWSVDDPDSSCRENWCGARGNIGHAFPADKAQELGKCGSR